MAEQRFTLRKNVRVKACRFMHRCALLALLLIVPGACCDLEIVTETLPAASIGQNYSFELDSDCGGDFWFLSEGTLPPGISFASDGDLSGVPTTAGTFLFTVGLEDFSGDVVFKGYTLIVTGPAP